VYNCRVFEAKEEEIPAVNVDSAWANAMNKRTFIRLFSAGDGKPGYLATVGLGDAGQTEELGGQSRIQH